LSAFCSPLFVCGRCLSVFWLNKAVCKAKAADGSSYLNGKIVMQFTASGIKLDFELSSMAGVLCKGE